MKKLMMVLVGVLILLPFGLEAREPFNKDLRYGMVKNSEVKRLQQFLKDEGVYTGPITGNFYSLTRDSVKKYQKDYRIKITGVFDKATRSKVNEVSMVEVEQKISPNIIDSTPAIPVGLIINNNNTALPPPSNNLINPNHSPASLSDQKQLCIKNAEIDYQNALDLSKQKGKVFEDRNTQIVQLIKQHIDKLTVVAENNFCSTDYGTTTTIGNDDSRKGGGNVTAVWKGQDYFSGGCSELVSYFTDLKKQPDIRAQAVANNFQSLFDGDKRVFDQNILKCNTL